VHTVANTVLIILKKSGKREILLQHVLPIADTVPVNLLLAALSLAEKQGVESTPDSGQSVNNGTLTAHADFAPIFGSNRLKQAFARNAVKMVCYGGTNLLNWCLSHFLMN
jgi:hypothetical protein